MKNALLLLTLVSFLLSSCSHKLYTNNTYLKQNNLDGKTVAILPVKVVFTGRLPANLTEENKIALEKSESLALQTQLYHELLFRSKNNSGKKSRVNFMEISVVNNKIKEAGINPEEATNQNVEELAKAIGADIVIRTQVRKNRFMSDLASMGIGAAVNVANILLGGTSAPYFYGANSLNKTYDISYDLNLYDVKEKTSISKYSRNVEADWNDTPEDIFGKNARYFAKRAPIKPE